MPPIAFNPLAVQRNSTPSVKAPIPELVDDPRHRIEEIQDYYIPTR